jgi:Cu/Ag efflux pump CusA
MNGIKVGEFYEDQNIFDVVVWGAPQVRSNLDALRSLKIETPTGGVVPLRDVADVYIAPTPNQIMRESASRYTEVTCNVRDRDLGSVARDIENKIKNIPFDRGYHPEILGEYAAQRASRRQILALSILALLGIFLILQSDFQSVRLALLVIVGLPFALIGGVLTAVFSGGVLSLGSLIGFVTVLGVAARNSIMLISHYRHLEKEEDQLFGLDLIIRGSKERLAPILMTAMTTALALMAIVLGGNRPGQEIEHPMALVVLGGLLSSTLLNLLVMPVLYWRFGKVGAQEKG